MRFFRFAAVGLSAWLLSGCTLDEADVTDDFALTEGAISAAQFAMYPPAQETDLGVSLDLKPKDKTVEVEGLAVDLSEIAVKTGSLRVRGADIWSDGLAVSVRTSIDLFADGKPARGTVSLALKEGKTLALPLPNAMELGVARSGDEVMVRFADREAARRAIHKSFATSRDKMKAVVDLTIKPKVVIEFGKFKIDLEKVIGDEILTAFVDVAQKEIGKDKTLDKLERLVNERLPAIELADGQELPVRVYPGPERWSLAFGKVMPRVAIDYLLGADAGRMRVVLNAEALTLLLRSGLVHVAGAPLPKGFVVERRDEKVVADFSPRSPAEASALATLFGEKGTPARYQFDVASIDVSGLTADPGGQGETRITVRASVRVDEQPARTMQFVLLFTKDGKVALIDVGLTAEPARAAGTFDLLQSLRELQAGTSALITRTVVSRTMIAPDHELARLAGSTRFEVEGASYLGLELELGKAAAR